MKQFVNSIRKNIDEYVELELANIDIAEYFSEMFVESVYYVTDGGDPVEWTRAEEK